MLERKLAPAALASAIVGLALTTVASTSARRPKRELLSQEDCHQLVLEALRGEGIDSENPTLMLLDEQYDPAFPDFFTTEARDAGPNGSFPSLGSFSVDMRTGDVWSATLCWEYKSPGLSRLQQEIRKKREITDKEYEKLKRRGPMCLPGEKPVIMPEARKHQQAERHLE